jgi:predicted RNase H-like HicB family nuclease
MEKQVLLERAKMMGSDEQRKGTGTRAPARCPALDERAPDRDGGPVTERVPLTALYQVVENGWVQARVQELPEVITVAPTLEEAKEYLLDALREFLLSLGSPAGGEAPSRAAEIAREPLTIELVT